MEVRADVRELLRLTNAELVDLKVSPKKFQNPEQAKNTPAKNTPAKNTPAKNTPKNTPAKHTSASAPTATATSQKLASAYDERVGTERRPLSRDVVEVLGVTPTVAVTAAANAAAADPVAVRVVAEVLRVRRVARLLAFATLRPLGAPVTVELDAHDRAARRASEGDGDERGFSSATFAGRRFRWRLGTELPVDRGTFPHGASRWRVRDGDGASRAQARRRRRGGGSAPGESSADDRGHRRAVDDAQRRGRRGRARPRAADAEDDAARDARDDRIAARDERDETTLESPPETNVFETNAAPRSRWQTREAKEEEWGVGPSAATAAMAAATSMTSMTSETSSSSETFARLRAGDREGKTIRFPSLPPASVSWVSDAEGALAARDAIFGDGSRPAAARTDAR